MNLANASTIVSPQPRGPAFPLAAKISLCVIGLALFATNPYRDLWFYRDVVHNEGFGEHALESARIGIQYFAPQQRATIVAFPVAIFVIVFGIGRSKRFSIFPRFDRFTGWGTLASVLAVLMLKIESGYIVYGLQHIHHFDTAMISVAYVAFIYVWWCCSIAHGTGRSTLHNAESSHSFEATTEFSTEAKIILCVLGLALFATNPYRDLWFYEDIAQHEGFATTADSYMIGFAGQLMATVMFFPVASFLIVFGIGRSQRFSVVPRFDRFTRGWGIVASVLAFLMLCIESSYILYALGYEHHVDTALISAAYIGFIYLWWCCSLAHASEGRSALEPV